MAKILIKVLHLFFKYKTVSTPAPDALHATIDDQIDGTYECDKDEDGYPTSFPKFYTNITELQVKYMFISPLCLLQFKTNP